MPHQPLFSRRTKTCRNWSSVISEGPWIGDPVSRLYSESWMQLNEVFKSTIPIVFLRELSLPSQGSHDGRFPCGITGNEWIFSKWVFDEYVDTLALHLKSLFTSFLPLRLRSVVYVLCAPFWVSHWAGSTANQMKYTFLWHSNLGIAGSPIKSAGKLVDHELSGKFIAKFACQKAFNASDNSRSRVGPVNEMAIRTHSAGWILLDITLGWALLSAWR